MKMILEKEDFLKNTIRDIVAVNPMVSVRRMQKLVEVNTKHSISKNYTAKLMEKMRRKAVIESDRKKVNERLAEMRERQRVHLEYLERMLLWRPEYHRDYGMQEPTLKEKMMAIKVQAHLENSLFRTELAAGVFENRQIAIAEMLKQGVLPTELNEQIVGVFRSWKMGPVETRMMTKAS